MNSARITNICCIGAGYVGGPTCAVIAAQNPHIKVTVVDLSEARIAAWKSSTLPVYEPGLYDIAALGRDGADGRVPNLHFSTDVSAAIDEADLIFIAVNTPTKAVGRGAGSAANLTYVESAVRKIARVSKSNKIIVEKSTVPCGTADALRKMLRAIARPDLRFDVLSNPEFLAEGTAMRDLMHPDRVLIGSLQDARSLAAANALASVYAAWVPPSRIICVNTYSSELAKLAANCMLAQRISSINSFSAICEATGADVEQLSRVIGLDSRMGAGMLKASAGFGGSCFQKDVLSLVYIAESLHLPEIAGYWRAVVRINEYQKERFTARILQRLHNTLSGKSVAVLGFAYKKNTGDTRESAAIAVVRQLLLENARVAIFDPQVTPEQIYRDLEDGSTSEDTAPEVIRSSIRVCPDAETACAGASAVVILTEWDMFKTDQVAVKARPAEAPVQELDEAPGPQSPDSGVDMSDPMDFVRAAEDLPKRIDWARIAEIVQRPRLVFDGRNVVDPARLAGLGFEVECIGKRLQS